MLQLNAYLQCRSGAFMVHRPCVEVIFMLLLFHYFAPEAGFTMFLANIYVSNMP